MLHARLPERQLEAILGMLEAVGLETIEKPWLAQAAFRRLRYQPGVDALEPFTNYGQRMQDQGAASDGGQE